MISVFSVASASLFLKKVKGDFIYKYVLLHFRLKMIETLSNLFRSVMVLTPDDLLQCVYLCLNQLAPAYEGVELGMGETLLMKAIAQATGKLFCHHDIFTGCVRSTTGGYVFTCVCLLKRWKVPRIHPIIFPLVPWSP